ncbi:MAG TPA: hypothetical protein VN758_00460 [Solirubrobacterales bacterium]|nr:hypothetical protein [Solirubrobacterales bacterium]
MPDLGLLLEAVALTIYQLAVGLGLAITLTAFVIAMCWLYAKWVRRTSVTPGRRVRPQPEQPVDLPAERERLEAALDRRREDIELRRVS